jgi:hypothetical protein
MTQDDLTKLALIKLAMESGFDKILDEHASEYRDGTFDRSEYPELLVLIRLAAEHEREACARLCESHVRQPSRLHFAAAIRARGNT